MGQGPVVIRVKFMRGDVGFQTFYASVLYVSSSGNCGNKVPCLDAIGKGISSAADGATIHIAEGVYEEDIFLRTPMALILDGGWDAAFTSQNGYTTAGSLIIRQGNITTRRVILRSFVEPGSGDASFGE